MNSNIINKKKKEPFDSGFVSRISVFPLFQSRIRFPLIFLRIFSFLWRGLGLDLRNKKVSLTSYRSCLGLVTIALLNSLEIPHEK